MTLFNQQNYTQELGVGVGYLISRYGCALVCLTMLACYYGKQTTPDKLNLDLVANNGFASNGTKTADGTDNLTLIKWGALAAVYNDILLEKNLMFPSMPADMGLIDSYLAQNKPVIVGVSFLHKPTDKVPSHYVMIYRKNSDGTYQACDPWYGDDFNFNARFAVNGMTAANAILQVVCYTGPVPEIAQAPQVAHAQQALTTEDILRADRDKNWLLYQEQVRLNETKDARIQELQGQVQGLHDDISQLTTEISNTKALNATLATHLATLEASDSKAVEVGQKAADQLKEKDEIVQQTAEILQTQPKRFSILQALDSVLSRLPSLKKEQPKSLLTILGLEKEVS